MDNVHYAAPALIRVDSAFADESIIATTLRGVEALSTPFIYHLACITTSTSINALANTPIQLRCQLGQTCRYIQGVVTATTALSTENHYELTIEPAMALLRHAVNSRIFQQQTVLDVIKGNLS